MTLATTHKLARAATLATIARHAMEKAGQHSLGSPEREMWRWCARTAAKKRLAILTTTPTEQAYT